MKRILASLFVLFSLVGCSPTWPLVQDTRVTATPEATVTAVATVTPEATVVVDPATATPVCLNIKANIGQNGTRIYFLPSSINYKNVKISLPGEAYYCTEAEAQQNGFRRSLK